MGLSTDNIVVPAGIPVPLTAVPTFKVAVEGRVTVGEPIVVVPLVSVKVSEGVPAAVAGKESVMSVPLRMDAIVVPGCIPAPLTTVPIMRPAVVGSPVTVVLLFVVPVRVAVVLVAVMVCAAPVTAVIVSGTPGEADVAVALADKVMSVPLTMDAIVVDGGIPGPLMSIPAASLAVEGTVTVLEPVIVAPVTVLLLLALIYPSKVKLFTPVKVGTLEMVISVPLLMAVMVVSGGMPFPVTFIPT